MWCGIKSGFGTRTITIFVGTRKYAKIRVPATKSDTGTHVAFGICVAQDSFFFRVHNAIINAEQLFNGALRNRLAVNVEG